MHKTGRQEGRREGGERGGEELGHFSFPDGSLPPISLSLSLSLPPLNEWTSWQFVICRLSSRPLTRLRRICFFVFYCRPFKVCAAVSRVDADLASSSSSSVRGGAAAALTHVATAAAAVAAAAGVGDVHFKGAGGSCKLPPPASPPSLPLSLFPWQAVNKQRSRASERASSLFSRSLAPVPFNYLSNHFRPSRPLAPARLFSVFSFSLWF